jgi:hypothetical protein
MNAETKNLPTTISNDFGDEVGDSDRLIQGTKVSCVDGVWTASDGSELPPEPIVISTTTAVQQWEDGYPITTIKKEPGKPLPDVDELNAKISQKKWEPGLNGTPRAPWERVEVVYLLNPQDASVFTFISSTAGARIAVRRLRDRVTLMRRLRGNAVVPIVKLDSKPMKTKYGQKLRPEFTILDWRTLSDPQVATTSSTSSAIEHVGASVKPVTLQEEMDDEIPFDDAVPPFGDTA